MWPGRSGATQSRLCWPVSSTSGDGDVQRGGDRVGQVVVRECGGQADRSVGAARGGLDLIPVGGRRVYG